MPHAGPPCHSPGPWSRDPGGTGGRAWSGNAGQFPVCLPWQYTRCRVAADAEAGNEEAAPRDKGRRQMAALTGGFSPTARWRRTTTGEYGAEYLGTFVLIMFGDGVVAM